MRITVVAAIRAPNARGKRLTEGDDSRGVQSQQHPRGVSRALSRPIVVAVETLDDPLGDGGQIDMRRRDETVRGGR